MALSLACKYYTREEVADMIVTNTLAEYGTESITTVKSFIVPAQTIDHLPLFSFENNKIAACITLLIIVIENSVSLFSYNLIFSSRLMHNIRRKIF